MKQIIISFSGGRTSAFMMNILFTMAPKEQLLAVFANTGQEDERTLEFVDRCSKEWNIPITWVEAAINPKLRKGTTHRLVDYKTATRDHSLFEEMIEKYGIPNKNYPHCTRELKLHPINSFRRSVGLTDDSYYMAVGIRVDEIDRINPNRDKHRIVYPLVRAKVRKEHVMRFWDQQPFDLELPEHRGNCVWCWKKSLRKHLTLAKETPEVFNFANRMDMQHAFTRSTDGKPRKFFRERRTAQELLNLSKQPFEAFSDQRHLDIAGSCEESCEIHSADQEP